MENGINELNIVGPSTSSYAAKEADVNMHDLTVDEMKKIADQINSNNRPWSNMNSNERASSNHMALVNSSIGSSCLRRWPSRDLSIKGNAKVGELSHCWNSSVLGWNLVLVL